MKTVWLTSDTSCSVTSVVIICRITLFDGSRENQSIDAILMRLTVNNETDNS